MRVIVTGTGGASGYAVALQAEQFGYDVLWADADPLCPALLLHPDRAWLLPPATDAAVYLKSLAEASKAFGTTCVSFNTDAEVRYVSTEPAAAKRAGLTWWTPDPSTVSTCLDKQRFAERLAMTGRFRTPRSFTLGEVRREFPAGGVFVKRRAGSGATDAVVCTGPLELEAWLARNPDGLVQEILTGREFSADCLYTGVDAPLVVLRERLRTRSGMSTVTKTFHDERLETSVAELVQELDVVGPSCVQGFLQPDGVVYTEVNVRFGGGCAAATWGPTHLVEMYLTMLTTGRRAMPAGVPGLRPPSTVTLVRPPEYFALPTRPDIGDVPASFD